jgi:hypothetical protein
MSRRSGASSRSRWRRCEYPYNTVNSRRAVLPNTAMNSMEDHINRQAHLQAPTVPLPPKPRRGHGDQLTDRLSSKLVGMLDLSHVDATEMAKFASQQTSKRYRRALERASRSRSSSPLPSPEDRKPDIAGCGRDRTAPRHVDKAHVRIEVKPRVRERGIPAKTYRAVMRLVLGIPLLPVAPQPRIQVPRHRPKVWAEVRASSIKLIPQSRQELCEALPYYRSFQSSLYMHKRTAYSYLLDGYPSP